MAAGATSNSRYIRRTGPGTQQLTVPGVRDGVVDGAGGTGLTLGWIYRHPGKAAKLVVRHPSDVCHFILRHPKKFFGGGKQVANKRGTLSQGVTLPACIQAEIGGLFQKLNVDFFEVTAPNRIGHMAGEVDLYLKERALAGPTGRGQVLVMDGACSANPHFFNYCREHFRAVITPALWEWLVGAFPSMSELHVKHWDYYHAYDESAACYDVHARWRGLPPLFQLTDEDSVLLRQTLNGWGLGRDDWYVCFHNREKGYSTVDDHHHAYRNASISDYLPAMQEVVSRGGWVIRMGDAAMTPLPAMKNVVDYATSAWKSPQLDVVLSAGARCFIGCSSGLFILPSVFGVPAGLVNLVPAATCAMRAGDIGIPKLYRSKETGRLLRFDEVFSSPMANYRFTQLYDSNGIETVSHDAEDILGITREMLATCDSSIHYSEEDEKLQTTFVDYFKPGHYGFGSVARTGRDFLKRYRHLIEPSD